MASGSGPASDASHWVEWHAAYEDPDSNLSDRLRLVQAAVAAALDERPPGAISVISLCAGQGRDVIDVVAAHERVDDVQALLVERDPDLAAFARARVAEAGLADRVLVIEGDAALARHYAGAVPADLVLVCGVFGNISTEDIAATVAALPSFCAPGASVIWTRHRNTPDLTPAIRAWFADAGFVEVSFDAPDGHVHSVGRERFDGATAAFDPERRLFEFIAPAAPAAADPASAATDPAPEPPRWRFSEWVGRRQSPRATGTRATPRELVQMVVRTARTEPGRVFLPAVVIFGLDSASSTFFTEVSIDHLGGESLAAFAVLLVSTLGLTFYSGLLERLVGAVERNEPAPPVSQVIRQLPYLRLLAADLILWVIGGVASAAFVIPGLIVTTLFALIGPLINLEDLPIRAAFRRSATLVAPQFLLVLCLVTVPIAVENELVEGIALLEHHLPIWSVFLIHLFMGLTLGVLIGLMEVSMANRLVTGAGGPGQPSAAPLPSDQPGRRGGHHGGDDSRDGHAGAGAVPPTG
jgi:hypothetical protein